MQSEKSRLIHIRLTPKLHERLRVRAAREDVSMQEWVYSIIERGLDEPAKRKGGGK